MSQSKMHLIWERQGRPKSPPISKVSSVMYAQKYDRTHVYRYSNTWYVWKCGICRVPFPTFADAIAYADRRARR